MTSVCIKIGQKRGLCLQLWPVSFWRDGRMLEEIEQEARDARSKRPAQRGQRRVGQKKYRAAKQR